MKKKLGLAAAALTVVLAAGSGIASAAPPLELPTPTQSRVDDDASAPSALYGQCWRVLGPFATQYRALQVRAYARARGYTVGPVYGQGGIITRYGRRYYFRVYYRC
ncbi:MAG: hypothetical protein KC503_28600 [Myxococcales bacterium]|nr:hypothetical protein [Myxococcales bacterium]